MFISFFSSPRTIPLTIFVLICIIIPEINSLINPSAPKAIKRSYGEPCDKTMRCRSQSWLSCSPQSGSCQCAKPDEMIYDVQKGKCVSLIGERCKYGFDEDPETPISDDKLSHKWYEKADCVHQAVCDSSRGICICPEGFYEDTKKNQCSPLRNYMHSCRNGFECNSDKLLTCIQNQCQCVLPSDMTFDPERDNCHILVGKKCYSHPQSFEKHARDGVELLKFKLLQKAECLKESHCSNLTSLCSCPSGFYIDFEKNSCQPVKKYGESCGNGSEECDTQNSLICIDGLCKCDPEISIYNEKNITDSTKNITIPQGTCLGKVGTMCRDAPENEGKFCMKNSLCGTDKKCKCSEGYEETSDKRCGLGFDKPCSMINGCSDKLTCSGDNMKGQMKCTCPHPLYQIYDEVNKTCQGIVGAPCSESACIRNAYCTNSTNDFNRFRCECSKGYIETVNGTCDIEFGYPCSYQEDNMECCDRISKLQCRGKWLWDSFKCSCANEDDIYEVGRRRCSIAVGLRCNTNEECVSNAFCQKDDNGNDNEVNPDINSKNGNGLAGRCVCLDGYKAGDNFTCLSEVELVQIPSRNLNGGDSVQDVRNSLEVQPESLNHFYTFV